MLPILHMPDVTSYAIPQTMQNIIINARFHPQIMRDLLDVLIPLASWQATTSLTWGTQEQHDSLSMHDA